MTITIEPGDQSALTTVKRELEGIPLTETVREKVGNHYEDLTRLAASLKTVGLDHHEIDHHVIEIFNEYRTELLLNIERANARDWSVKGTPGVDTP
jgi:hypothetical protein